MYGFVAACVWVWVWTEVGMCMDGGYGYGCVYGWMGIHSRCIGMNVVYGYGYGRRGVCVWMGCMGMMDTDVCMGVHSRCVYGHVYGWVWLGCVVCLVCMYVYVW